MKTISKFSFVYEGVLYIHVNSYELLAAEMEQDRADGMPYMIWLDDGMPGGMLAGWSKCLDSRVLNRERMS